MSNPEVMFMFKNLVKSLFEYGKKMSKDHMGAYAAQSAFFIILSFFPFINILLMLAKYLPFTRGELISMFSKVVPSEFDDYIVEIINDIYFNNMGSFTLITIIVALWSAAKGIMAISNGLNEIYDIEEKKNYFTLRAFCMLYTGGLIIIIVLILVLYVFGNGIANNIITKYPDYENITTLVIGLRSSGSFLILFLFFWGMYCILPGEKRKLRFELPGAAFTSLAWVLLTRLFSIYVQEYGKRSYMYGSLTTIILMIFWLYIGMYIIFIGGQINRFLEKTNYLKDLKHSAYVYESEITKEV